MPLNEVYCILKYDNAVIIPMLDGIDPMNLLPYKEKELNFDSWPISDGNVPLIAVYCILKYDNEVIIPMLDGIDPMKLL